MVRCMNPFEILSIKNFILIAYPKLRDGIIMNQVKRK
jgi:hypothetical protein